MSKFEIMEKITDEEMRKREEIPHQNMEMQQVQGSTATITAEAIAQEVEPLLLAITNVTTTITRQMKEAMEQCRKAEDASIRFLHKMGGSLSETRNMTEEAKNAAQAAMNEAQEANKAALQASACLQEQSQKIRLTAEAMRWAYPLITAVVVSLLWAALLLWQMPDYGKMTTWQGQIWHKLESMSSTQINSRSETEPARKR